MRTIDLFSGCGGMSLGFQNASFDVVAAFDNWEPAVNIYSKNFTHPIYKADLNEDAPVDQIGNRLWMFMNSTLSIRFIQRT